MKCNFCGADIRKSDEICPECGKYLTADPESAEKTNGKTEKFGKVLRFYDYNDGLAFYSLLFVFSGLAVIGFALYLMWDFGYYSFRFSSFATRMLICAALGILLIIFGIVSYFKQKSCSVTLCENGIYGYIPTNPSIPFKTVYFEAYYDDIEKIGCQNIGMARRSRTIITLRTATDKFSISLLKKENTTDLLNCLYELIDM